MVEVGSWRWSPTQGRRARVTPWARRDKTELTAHATEPETQKTMAEPEQLRTKWSWKDPNGA